MTSTQKEDKVNLLEWLHNILHIVTEMCIQVQIKGKGKMAAGASSSVKVGCN